jgi:hypothetical protein
VTCCGINVKSKLGNFCGSRKSTEVQLERFLLNLRNDVLAFLNQKLDLKAENKCVTINLYLDSHV